LNNGFVPILLRSACADPGGVLVSMLRASSISGEPWVVCSPARAFQSMLKSLYDIVQFEGQQATIVSHVLASLVSAVHETETGGRYSSITSASSRRFMNQSSVPAESVVKLMSTAVRWSYASGVVLNFGF
jgi:hypothetical protein